MVPTLLNQNPSQVIPIKQVITDEEKEIIAKLTLKITELQNDAIFVPPITRGPILSVFRFIPSGKSRVSHIEKLATDFAITLGVEDVLVKRLPGETAVGVFAPNAQRQTIEFMNCINDVWRVKDKFKLPLMLGVDYMGASQVVDLVEMPHLLIAGSTGSGKSTLLTSIIGTLAYCVPSSKVQLVLSDTKGVEFGNFIGLPHMMFELATTIYKTLEQLEWVVDEMEERLKTFQKANVRNIHEYNNVGEAPNVHMKPTSLPFIIVIIDELADLLQHKGEKRGESRIAEDKISIIVQKSRAVGIYLIAATQRPSVNIVSGSIKANFPARLTFRLPSEIDSRTVVGTGGAEHLLAQGDMLFVNPNKPGIQRLHAPFARQTEIKGIVDASIGK